jgi:hypothetical protein
MGLPGQRRTSGNDVQSKFADAAALKPDAPAGRRRERSQTGRFPANSTSPHFRETYTAFIRRDPLQYLPKDIQSERP